MDFRLTEDQQLMVQAVRELMESESWEPYFAQCDAEHAYPQRWVAALCELGGDTILLPEERGGLDAGWTTVAAVWEELGRLGAPTYVLYQLPTLRTVPAETTLLDPDVRSGSLDDLGRDGTVAISSEAALGASGLGDPVDVRVGGARRGRRLPCRCSRTTSVTGEPTWREVTGTVATSTSSTPLDAEERTSRLVSGLCTRPTPTA